MLACPKCHSALELGSTDALPLAHCRACSGQWIAEQTLRLLLERRDSHEAARRVAELPVQSSPTDLTCPACRGALAATWIAEVEVDYCHRCRGVFLDRGELERVALRDQTLDAVGRTEPKRGDGLRSLIAALLDD